MRNTVNNFSTATHSTMKTKLNSLVWGGLAPSYKDSIEALALLTELTANNVSDPYTNIYLIVCNQR